MVDEFQIFEAKAYGADVILLISECLTAKEVDYLAKFAHNLGLEVLLEMHAADQLDKISDAVDCVGVNNRNLKTFEVNLQSSIDLSSKIPDRFIKVAESGISDPKNVGILRGYGFEGFLIGEAFMKTENPSAAITDFVARIPKWNTKFKGAMCWLSIFMQFFAIEKVFLKKNLTLCLENTQPFKKKLVT